MNRMRFVFRRWAGSVQIVLQKPFFFFQSEHSLIIGGLLTNEGMEIHA